jgi:hypothetical protein
MAKKKLLSQAKRRRSAAQIPPIIVDQGRIWWGYVAGYLEFSHFNNRRINNALRDSFESSLRIITMKIHQ